MSASGRRRTPSTARVGKSLLQFREVPQARCCVFQVDINCGHLTLATHRQVHYSFHRFIDTNGEPFERDGSALDLIGEVTQHGRYFSIAPRPHDLHTCLLRSFANTEFKRVRSPLASVNEDGAVSTCRTLLAHRAEEHPYEAPMSTAAHNE